VVSEKTIKKAKELGIHELDLKAALLLVREFRREAVVNNLDARAMRIAILYGEMVDFYFAQQKLSTAELEKLKEIARDLFTETVARLRL